MAMQTETGAHWYQWPNQSQERHLTGELDLLFDLLQDAVNRHEIDSLWVDESVAGVNWEVLGVPVRRLTDDEEL
ncbi:hypothetical protein [Weissella cibaria]|nr:hypothetical protein [Weissella cibaria]ALI34010.1 hypothetical protein AO080_11405 [Weissella cibaria]